MGGRNIGISRLLRNDGRISGSGRSRNREKLRDRQPEAREQVAAFEHVALRQQADVLARAVGGDAPRGGIDDPYETGPGREILQYLLTDLGGPARGRDDLDCEVGRAPPESGWKAFRWHTLRREEGDVGAADRRRIDAQHAAHFGEGDPEPALAGVGIDPAGQLDGQMGVPGARKLIAYDPPADELDTVRVLFRHPLELFQRDDVIDDPGPRVRHGDPPSVIES